MPDGLDLIPARDLARGVLRCLLARDYVGVTEMTLANGRRADVAALGPGGEIEIIEIKSSIADFQSDRKWPDYEDFCDRFYFAVAAAFPRELVPAHCGLIIADGFGGAIVRQPPARQLAAARRKAMTLKLARLAALRLASGSGLLVPGAGLATS